MTLFRNTKDNTLNKMFRVSPRSYTGSYLEAQNYFTGAITRVTESQKKFFIPVAKS
jgi:hypothetical protein